ncbi:MAG: Hpt domain-containing protein [Phycisphaerales bacterium]|nr:Hpt domain-containing protein [Phycisphaerales bacterium]
MASEAGNRIASELVKTDPDLTDIVEEYVAGLPQRLARMQQAVAQSNFDDLKIAAHQLKGSAGGYGYPTLTQAAGRLEQQAVQRTLEQCQASVTDLADMISRVVVRE